MRTDARVHAQIVAQIYDRRAIIPFDGSTYTDDVLFDLSVLRHLVNSWPPILCDVGCGLGWHLEALAAQGGTDLWGIDLSEQSLSMFATRFVSGIPSVVKLIAGDVRAWKCTGFFSAVTSFLSCLGEFSPDGDQDYMDSLARLLRPGGVLLISVFCQEEVEPILGEWTTTYSDSDKRPVITTLTYGDQTRSLHITQKFEDEVNFEIMRLYTQAELIKLAEHAGLVGVRILRPLQFGAKHGRASKSGLVFLTGQARH